MFNSFSKIEFLNVNKHKYFFLNWQSLYFFYVFKCSFTAAPRLPAAIQAANGCLAVQQQFIFPHPLVTLNIKQGAEARDGWRTITAYAHMDTRTLISTQRLPPPTKNSFIRCGNDQLYGGPSKDRNKSLLYDFEHRFNQAARDKSGCPWVCGSGGSALSPSPSQLCTKNQGKVKCRLAANHRMRSSGQTDSYTNKTLPPRRQILL